MSMGMGMAFAGIAGVGSGLHDREAEVDTEHEDEIEEVEAFSPVVTRPGERVEERIFEEGEEEDGPPTGAAALDMTKDGDKGKQQQLASMTTPDGCSSISTVPVAVASPKSTSVPIIRKPMLGRSGSAGASGSSASDNGSATAATTAAAAAS